MKAAAASSRPPTALERLQKCADALILFDNSRMGELVLPKDGIQKAFSQADQLIAQSVRAVTGMIGTPGIVKLGLDDLVSALRTNEGRCLFGFGEAKGQNRGTEALKKALKSPLINQGQLLQNAKNLLVHIVGGESLTLAEVEVVMKQLGRHVPDDTQILFGIGVEPKLGESVTVTLVSSLSAIEMAARPVIMAEPERREAPVRVAAPVKVAEAEDSNLQLFAAPAPEPEPRRPSPAMQAAIASVPPPPVELFKPAAPEPEPEPPPAPRVQAAPRPEPAPVAVPVYVAPPAPVAAPVPVAAQAPVAVPVYVAPPPAAEPEPESFENEVVYQSTEAEAIAEEEYEEEAFEPEPAPVARESGFKLASVIETPPQAAPAVAPRLVAVPVVDEVRIEAAEERVQVIQARSRHGWHPPAPHSSPPCGGGCGTGGVPH